MLSPRPVKCVVSYRINELFWSAFPWYFDFVKKVMSTVKVLDLEHFQPTLSAQFTAHIDDRTARSMIGYWHHRVVCLSVCL